MSILKNNLFIAHPMNWMHFEIPKTKEHGNPLCLVSTRQELHWLLERSSIYVQNVYHFNWPNMECTYSDAAPKEGNIVCMLACESTHFVMMHIANALIAQLYLLQ